jgi:hypothetical protein
MYTDAQCMEAGSQMLDCPLPIPAGSNNNNNNNNIFILSLEDI